MWRVEMVLWSLEFGCWRLDVSLGSCAGHAETRQYIAGLRECHCGMRQHPLDVRAAGVLDGGAAVGDGRTGFGRKPPVQFAVAIRKVERAGPLMVAAGQVVPLVRIVHLGP